MNTFELLKRIEEVIKRVTKSNFLEQKRQMRLHFLFALKSQKMCTTLIEKKTKNTESNTKNKKYVKSIYKKLKIDVSSEGKVEQMKTTLQRATE